MKNNLPIVFAAFVFCIMLLAGPAAIYATEPITISSQEIHKAASDNLKNAEALYLGKIITVKGIVVAKGMSRYLTPTVTLSNVEGGAEQVICVLPRLDAGKLSGFQIGQSLAMTGKVYRLGERVIVKESRVAE